MKRIMCVLGFVVFVLWESSAQVISLSGDGALGLSAGIHLILEDTSISNSGDFKGESNSVVVLKGAGVVDVSGLENISVGDLKLETDVVLNTSVVTSGDVEMVSGDLDIQDSDLTLGGNLIDESESTRVTSTGSGLLIKPNVSLQPGVTTSPGDIGITITPSEQSNNVTIKRGFQPVVKDGGEESLERFFSFTNANLLNAKVLFSYFDAELSSATADESEFSMWGSTTGNWIYLGDFDRDGFDNTVSASVNKNIDKLTLFKELKELIIPEGFSPNGDGVNDEFVIDNVDAFPNNKLVVFNRWGSIVYEKESYDNSWTGDNKDALISTGSNYLVNGVYYYVFYKDKDNSSEVIKGFVALSRDVSK